MNKSTFLAGLASSVVIAQNWRTIAKEGVKVGVRAGRKLREVSHLVKEGIEDISAEAMDELKKDDAPPPRSNDPRAEP